MSSTESNVITIALESIQNDDLDLLDKCLRIMPIEKIKDKSETLLSTFLSTCAYYQRDEAAKYVLDRWKVVYPDIDTLSIIPRLFLKNIFNNATLSYIISIHPDITYVELIDELIQWDSSQEVEIACRRLDEIFGKRPLETYQLLRDKAKEEGNYVVEEYMIDRIQENSPFVSKPEYVKNYLSDYLPEYKDKLPTSNELDQLAEEKAKETLKEETFETISDDKAVDLLTQGLSELGITVDEIDKAREVIRMQIQDKRIRKELLGPILENLKQSTLTGDRVFFWICGPSNRLVNQDLTLNTPSAKYGGCRMFLTNLFDYDEEFDKVEDWFTGSCDQCLYRIEYRHYAVRQPRPHGGWQNCFCSFKCCREYVSDIEANTGEPDILTHDLIDIFENEINANGIQDRTY